MSKLLLFVSGIKPGKLLPVIFFLASAFLSQAVFSNTFPAKGNTLRVGVIPYLSARSLVQTYEPLRQYLEARLGFKVEIYTAKNFLQFVRSAEAGEYDVAIAASHFARYLQLERKFEPLVRFSTDGRALIVVKQGTQVHNLTEFLNNKVIAVPDNLAMASIVAVSYLKKHGLVPGRNINLVNSPSFPSAIQAVKLDTASAAITAEAVLNKIPEDISKSVTVAADAGSFVNLVIAVSSDMDKGESKFIQDALLKLRAGTREYASIVEPIGFGEIIKIRNDELKSLDQYMQETKDNLEN